MTDHSSPTQRRSEGIDFLSDAQIKHRLDGLAGADCWRLEQSARIYADGTGWSAGDLLQEAFVAALDRRRWRSDLDARTFLIGVMRSLAFSRRKSQRVDALDTALRESGEAAEHAFDDLVDRTDDPESTAADAETSQYLVGRLETLFAQDAQVLRVLRGRAAEEEPAKIRSALGVTASQYETICRRLLRGYQKSIKAEPNE